MPSYEILGIGNPILDYIIPVDHSFLETIPGEKGGMVPVNYETFQKLLKSAKTPPTIIPGGSGSNTIRGLANLGCACGLIGMIGNDDAAKQYMDFIKPLPIFPLFHHSNNLTEQVICLITPEGERTCRSFLGASKEMKPDQYLTPNLFEKVKLVHIEGYSLLHPGLTERAIKLAKEVGAKISLDLGSFEVVREYKKIMIKLVTNSIDILFANDEETSELTSLPSNKGCEMLKDLCETVVVLQGKEGCLVGHQGEIKHFPAYPVEPLDSTGAGDFFASGFLYGYLKQLSMKECADYGALLAREVVQNLGANISPEGWANIEKTTTEKGIC